MGNESLDHLLERCLQEMERTEDMDAVLRRYPEHADELRPLLQLAATVTERYAGVPEPRAELAEGWARLSREADKAREAARGQKVAGRRQQRRSRMKLRLAPTLIGVVVAVAVGMAGLAGVARAAGDAVPGDPLYAVKGIMEAIEGQLTFSPEAQVAFGFDQAETRMVELEELSQRQDRERVQEALGRYDDTVAGLLGQAEGRVPALSTMLEEHGNRMDSVFQPQEGENEGVEQNPVASWLAESYGVGEETIMEWFEEGYGFGEIMLVLRTGMMLEGNMTCYEDGDLAVAAECLLARKTDEYGWGDVWRDLGLIGEEGENDGPPFGFGLPFGVGKPDDDAGPPIDVPEKPDEAGRPDDDDGEGGPPVIEPPDDPGPPDGVPPVEPPVDEGAGEDEGAPPDEVTLPEEAEEAAVDVPAAGTDLP